MTQSDSNTTASPATPVSRRGIVRGAAWTVPVVAASIAAPALAVSPTCPEGTPDLGEQAGWTATVVNPEQFAVYHRDNGQLWISEREYGWFGDHVSAVAGEPNALMTLTKQIPVVAGTTYVFEYGIRSAYTGVWQPVSLTASFGDQQIVDWSNASDVPQNEGVSVYAPRQIRYTAATTGTIPFTFTFTVPPRSDAPAANQDFAIIFPEDATTCLPG